MIRQARTYLVSAMSGATLIAVAIVAFVLLVSAQVFEAWPVKALGGGDDAPHVSRAQAVPGAASARSGNLAVAAGRAAPAPSGGGSGGNGAGGGQPSSGGGSQAPQASFGGDPESAGGGSGGNGSGGGGSGGSGGNGSGGDSPAASQPAGNGGGSNGSPATPAGGSSGGGSGSGGGSSSGGGGATTTSTSGKLTETVNETVNGVDEKVLGGALHESGVTEVTESVVNGVAGPESVVGHVVDETGKALGGLLGGNR